MTTFAIPDAPTAEEQPRGGPLVVPVAVLKSHALTSDEPNRYAIGGVRFEREGDSVFAIATDGRRLGIVEWKDGGDVPSGVVPAGALRMALEASKGITSEMPLRYEIADNAVTVVGSTEKVVTSATPIDGKFPRWRYVMPDLGDYASAFIDARFLRDLLRVVETGNVDDRGVWISVHREDGKGHPIVVSLDLGESKSVAILMPVSADGVPGPVQIVPPLVGERTK